MSRRIKTYPFNQRFNDEIAVDANTIKDMKLPGAYVESLSIATGEREIVSLRAEVYALEESKGIHFYLVEETKDGVETGNTSDEIVIDEIAFCDALHEAICNDITIEECKYVRRIITSEIEKFAKTKMSGDKWLTTINYDGHGVIMSSDFIIGTVDRTTFNKENIVLDYCVGNFNLNNIENCSIVFKTENKIYRLSDISMESVTSDNNSYYCTYTISKYKGEFLNELPVNESIFDGFINYSETVADEWLEQRTKIIDNEEEQDNSLYDDIL